MRRELGKRAGRCAAAGLVVMVLAAWTIHVRAADSDQIADDPPPDIVVAETAPTTNAGGTGDFQTLAAETIELMQQAHTELTAGRVTDEGGARQLEIVEQLQRMAELARQQSASVSAGRQESPGKSGSPVANGGAGEGASTNPQDAGESNESATGDPATTEAGARTARDLATSVWGHLPARERDRMQSRFSERFLPQYDRLVRQYYEALATDGSVDP